MLAVYLFASDRDGLPNTIRQRIQLLPRPTPRICCCQMETYAVRQQAGPRTVRLVPLMLLEVPFGRRRCPPHYRRREEKRRHIALSQRVVSRKVETSVP